MTHTATHRTLRSSLLPLVVALTLLFAAHGVRLPAAAAGTAGAQWGVSLLAKGTGPATLAKPLCSSVHLKTVKGPSAAPFLAALFLLESPTPHLCGDHLAAASVTAAAVTVPPARAPPV